MTTEEGQVMMMRATNPLTVAAVLGLLLAGAASFAQSTTYDVFLSDQGIYPNSGDVSQSLQGVIDYIAPLAAQSAAQGINDQYILHFDSGTYDLAAEIQIISTANIKLSGDPSGGTSLRFWSRFNSSISVIDSDGIQLCDLRIGYLTRAFTQGVIVAVHDSIGVGDDHYIEVLTDLGFPNATVDTFFQLGSNPYAPVQSFDPITKKLKKDGRSLTCISLSSTPANPSADTRITLQASPSQSSFAPGDLFTLRNDLNLSPHPPCILALGCTQIAVQNLEINESREAGIQIELCRDVEIQGCRVLPLSGALLSTNRDGIRIVDCVQNIVVDGCTLDRTGDDAIAFLAIAATVTQAASQSTTITVSGNGAALPFMPGEIIRFHDDLVSAHLGDAIVTGASANPQGVWTVTLDPTTPVTVAVGDSVYSLDRVSRHFEITNNKISSHRARAIICKASYGEISDNVIDGCSHGGIQLGPDFGSWNEGGFVEDVCVMRNKIRNVWSSKNRHGGDNASLGAISVGVRGAGSTWPTYRGNKRIKIADNSVISSGLAGLFLSNIDGVEVTGNRLLNCQQLPTTTGGAALGLPHSISPLDSPIYLIECDNAQIFANTVEHSDLSTRLRTTSCGNVEVHENVRADLVSFETSDGWPFVSTSAQLPNSTQLSGGVLLEGVSFGLFGNSATYPYYIDRQAGRAVSGGAMLRITVTNPTELEFMCSSNTSTANTWTCDVMATLVGTGVQFEVDSFSNDSQFLMTGKAPNFDRRSYDLSSLPRGQYEVTIQKIGSSGSPYMYVDDLLIAFDECVATGFETAEGWPNYEFAPVADSTWPNQSPSSIEAGFSFSYFGLISGAASDFVRGEQAARCDSTAGSMVISGLVNPTSIGFNVATLEFLSPMWSLTVSAVDSSDQVWHVGTVLGAQLPSKGAYYPQLFPLSLPPGTYSFVFVRSTTATGSDFVLVDDLRIERGDLIVPHAYPCPPWN